MIKIRHIIIYTVFIFLILISFRKILFTPGIIGHTWDWGMPYFSEQFIDKLKSNFFIWDDTLEGGRFLYFRFELLFWILIFPFSYLGTEAASKIIPMVFLFISALSMFKLCKYYKMKDYWSGIAGIFYMFSPITYSRIVAGHLTILFCYSLLPFIILYLQKIIDAVKNAKKIEFKDIFIITILYYIQTTHTFMFIFTAGISMVFFLWHFIVHGFQWRFLKILTFISFLLIMINSYWIYPFINDYLINRRIGHDAGLSMSPEEGVMEEKELPLRRDYLRSTSQPVYRSVILSSKSEMSTEYIWPVKNMFKNIWSFISLAISFIFFGFLIYKKKPAIYFLGPYFISAILGISLVSGYRTVWGTIIYRILYKIMPLIYMDMSHASRMLIYVCLSYTVGTFYILNYWEELVYQKRYYLRFAGAFSILVFTMPFLNNSLLKPFNGNIIQPHCLKINLINPEEREVYGFFRNMREDFRLTYIPPALLSWPGDNLNYEWNIINVLSPKPEYLGYPHMSLLSSEIVKNMYSYTPSPYLAKLLGIANVKYIVYPNYDFFISFTDFIPEYRSNIKIGGYKNYKPIVDASIKKQKDIPALNKDFKTVKIFENKSFLPHIYLARTKNIVFCNRTSFTGLSYTSCLDNYPVFFFIEDRKEFFELAKESGDRFDNIYAVWSEGGDIGEVYVPADDIYMFKSKLTVKTIEEEKEIKTIEEEKEIKSIEKKKEIKSIEKKKEIKKVSKAEHSFKISPKWKINQATCRYQYKLLSEKDIMIRCDFAGSAKNDEYVCLSHGLNINLKINPVFELYYRVEDEKVQDIDIWAGLDFNSDGLADVYIRLGSPYPAKGYRNVYRINAYDIIKYYYPGKLQYFVVDLKLYLHKVWGFDCSQPRSCGTYSFWIGDVKFASYIKRHYAKVYNEENMYSESKDGGWHIGKREVQNYKIESAKGGVALKKYGKTYRKLYKSFAKPIDLSKWQYIKFKYISNNISEKDALIFVDLKDRKNINVADMFLRNDGELNSIDINLFEALKIIIPELKSFFLEKIKIEFEEKISELKEADSKIYKNKKNRNELLPAGLGDAIILSDVQFYRLENMNSLALQRMSSGDNDEPDYSTKGYPAIKSQSLRGLIMEIFKKKEYKTETYSSIMCIYKEIKEGWQRIKLDSDQDINFDREWTVMSRLKERSSSDDSPEMEFTKKNPTKYTVNVKGVKRAFWLVFQENYHTGWTAYITKILNGGKDISKINLLYNTAIWSWVETRKMKKLKKHFKVNGYANGWYIDNVIDRSKNNSDLETEDFRIVIVFKPQRYYEIGLMASAVFIFICAGIVIVKALKSRYRFQSCSIKT